MSVTETETVGQHLVGLLDDYFRNGDDFTKVSNAYQELVRDRGLVMDSQMPEPEPEPEPTRLQVSDYLGGYAGEDMAFYVSCSTTVRLDPETSQLIFEGYDRHENTAHAVLNIERLLADLHRDA